MSVQRFDAVTDGYAFDSHETPEQGEKRLAEWCAQYSRRADSNEPGVPANAPAAKPETAYERMVRESRQAHETGSDSRKGPSSMDPMADDTERRDDSPGDAVSAARARNIRESIEAHRVGSPSRIVAK